jgi:TonB family protein
MTLGLWLDNLLAYSLQIAALAAAGTVLPLVLKLRHPGVLLHYWQALLAACLLLPVMQPWRSLPVGTDALNDIGTVQIQTRLAVATDGSVNLSLPNILVAVLALGALARLTWLGVGFCRLRLYVRKAHSLHPLPEAVVEMCRLVGVNPPMYFSSEIASPVAFGFWKPLILVPESFREMPQDFQRAISCHELWHVRRNDWLFVLLQEVSVAVLWFHPAMWWLSSRIQLSREQVIDRLVLKTTGERKPYLDALLQTALARGRTELTFAPLFLTKHHLTQRVALILTEVAMSRTRIAIAVAVLFALLSLTGRFVMRAFPLESPPSPTGPADASLQAQRSTAATLRAASRTIPPEELSLIHQTRPTYPVEAKIQRIQGEVLLAVNVNEKGEVDNIEVLKGPAPLVLSALDAVKRWRYAPYLKDGVAVPVSSTVTVNFALAGTKPAGEQVQGAGMVRTDERVTLRTPRLAYRVEPVYPLEAKEKGIEGEVHFVLTVDEHGNVTDVRVLRGNAMLVSAAYEAVRQWKYTSVFMDGVPIRVYVSVAIKFELNPKSAADSKPAADIPAAAINAPQAEWLRQRPSEEELKRRVEYANTRFASDGVSGSITDRGRVYVEWGPPDQIESHPSGGPVSEPVALRISGLDRDESDPFEIWTYRRVEQGKAAADLLVGFVGKDYRLASPLK